MPLHVHPHLRSLELMEEGLGLIKTLNSVGFNIQVAEEASGKKPPAQLPAGPGFFVLGQKIGHQK